MSQQQNKSEKNDLNDLLDNALEDFSKNDAVEKKTTDAADTKTTTIAEGAAAAASNGVAAGAEASADDPDAYFMEQAKLVAERMNTLFGGADTPQGDLPPMPQDPDQIVAGFRKMAEAAALTLQGENPANDEDVAKYSDSIAQALRGLQEGADGLQAPVSETDVASMFGNLNLEGGAAEGDANSMFLPFMEGMMQSLLSAEILLPSIKELVEKYPKFFEEHGDTISAEDKERFDKQLELYKIIESHLEEEKPEDTPAIKRQKFKVILDYMRKLQEYGQPPDQILAETVNDLPVLDPTAGGAGANPQCPTM